MQFLETPESSNIKSIFYDAALRTLLVKFKDDDGEQTSTYLFEEVSKEAWDKFVDAPSKGIYFNQQIKKQFTGRKL